METSKMDFTLTFSALNTPESIEQPPYTDSAFLAWHEAWKARLSRQPHSMEQSIEVMRACNPVVIPRNHIVEEALTSATHGDLSLFHRLLAVVTHPFDVPNDPLFVSPPPSDHPPYQTFCGT
jgi:uncharacterized protein YdiU (UPF0061 family)